MHWPPNAGDLLPRAAEAVGAREKLVGYSLNAAHKVGGPKARGFKRILGITIKDVDYLEATIQRSILITPIGSVRSGVNCGVNCVVEVPVRGVGKKSQRSVVVRTVWELTDVDAVPRLVSAYPRP